MKLGEKIALVTGAGQGIGRVIAWELAKEGAKVVVNDIALQRAESLAREITGKSGEALAVGGDVADEEEVAMMFLTTHDRLGEIDVLVNNAGIMNSGEIEEMTVLDWDRTMAVNLRGTFLCSRAVLAGMKQKGWGRIINIASLAGQSGGIMVRADYAASKGGVLAFTKSLARTVARYGITVNAISPGTVETAMAASYGEEKRQALLSSIPIGRFGQPEDVAKAVVFLASEEASFITGATLDVNGGLLMR